MPGAVKASVGNDTGCIWLSAPTWKEYALQSNYQLVLGIARFKRAKKLTASLLAEALHLLRHWVARLQAIWDQLRAAKQKRSCEH